MPDPTILSLAPAGIAIVLALATRKVILSLACGVLLGGLLATWNGGVDGVLSGFVHASRHYLVAAAVDLDHLKIVIFSLFVAASVNIIYRSGGASAMVTMLLGRTHTRRRAEATMLGAGLVVFFDDYANCLVVGSSMRPVADRVGVSRAKLAYIIDSTSAPVATLALVSTWVGFEVDQVAQGLAATGRDLSAYAFFLDGWGYRFYPWFALAMVAVVVATGRDFPAMRRTQRAANCEDDAAADPAPSAAPTHGPRRDRRLAWLAGVLPIAALLVATLSYLWIAGHRGLADDARLFEVLGNADPYDAMMWASLVCFTTASITTLSLGALRPDTLRSAIAEGFLSLREALIILVLAWSLGTAMSDLRAAAYLTATIDQSISPQMLPTAVFLVAAVISFATGTSFTTMSILMPVVIPLAFSLAPESNIPVIACASVLSGACFGDHCSPISDTTVLSSMGAQVNVIEHVRTQMPYALACGTIAIVFGTIPSGFGAPLWITLPAGVLGCLGLVRLAGKRCAAPR